MLSNNPHLKFFLSNFFLSSFFFPSFFFFFSLSLLSLFSADFFSFPIFPVEKIFFLHELLWTGSLPFFFYFSFSLSFSFSFSLVSFTTWGKKWKSSHLTKNMKFFHSLERRIEWVREVLRSIKVSERKLWEVWKKER